MDDGKEFCVSSVCRGKSRLGARTIRITINKSTECTASAAAECQLSSTPSESDQASEFERQNDEQMEALVSPEEDVHAGFHFSDKVGLESN